MPLHISCDCCVCPIDIPGAILWVQMKPGSDSYEKYHICGLCYLKAQTITIEDPTPEERLGAIADLYGPPTEEGKSLRRRMSKKGAYTLIAHLRGNPDEMVAHQRLRPSNFQEPIHTADESCPPHEKLSK